MKRLLILLLLGLVIIGATPQPAYGIERSRIEATHTDAPIRADGILDEPAWALAPPITDFRLILQREGELPSESTVVRVLFDDGRIYFGISCSHHGPGRVRASLTPRDQITDGDHIAVHLDTYRDQRRAYIFGINPYGVQLDGILDGSEPDFSWDAVWEGEAKRHADGWNAELAIPLRSMRFPRQGDGVWGLWIRRAITRNDEVCSWPLWRAADQGDIMQQAGDLTALTGLVGGGGFEAEPYVSSLAQRNTSYAWQTGPAALPTLQHSNRDVSTSSAGLDLRYAVTSTLIANATANPDYSQIEADAIQIDVNQRFPLFYPEKRPFFLEGAEIFSTPLDLVYTRRIADPDLGGKITGKLGKASLGAISVRDDGGGSFEGVGAGGEAGGSRHGEFHVGRLAYDLGEKSRLGFLVTAHHSAGRPNGPPRFDVPDGLVPQGGHNVVLSADSHLRFGKNLFFKSQVAWSTSRIDSSSDYRGDQVASHHGFSDAAYLGSLRFADGIREVELYQTYLGPEFRNESGFLERVDIRETGIRSNFFARPENAWLRSWQPILNGYAIHDHTGGLQEWWVSPMVDWVFQKQTTMHTMYVRARQRWQGRDYDLNSYIFNFGNTMWRPLDVSFNIEVGDGIFYAEAPGASFKGWSEQYEWSATARPDPRLTSEMVAKRRRFSRELGGTEVYDVWALGAKTTFQFTRQLYARVYPQYDTGGHHLDADALVAYVLHPGSVLYVGVNGAYDKLEGRHRPTQRTVFFKASHRFGV